MSSSLSRVSAHARVAARTAALTAYTAHTVASFDFETRGLTTEQRDAVLERYRRQYCTRMLHVFGVQWELTPESPPKQAKGRLIVANHRSVLDIPVLVATFGGTMLSRADVAKWPLLGPLAQRAQTIFVDRGSKTSGAAAIRNMHERLAEGATVTVFPEGGTHRGDQVHEFRAGAFAAARGLDVEVVPVGLAHDPDTEYAGGISFTEHLRGLAERPHTRVVGRIGSPLKTQQSASLAELARRARQQVQQLVHEARQAHPGLPEPSQAS
jgi:1-acyl-sn-glycerol-3-phosphate acyltransferase